MSEKSFEQLLRSQMDQESSSHQWNFNSQSYSGSDACLEFLCAASNVKQKFGRRFKEMFTSQPATSEAMESVQAEQPTATVFQEPLVGMETLDFAALGAVELFRRHGEELAFPLSESQLKSSWRKLAKKTHPDVASKSDSNEVLDFQISRDAYLLLKSFFSDKQAA